MGSAASAALDMCIVIMTSYMSFDACQGRGRICNAATPVRVADKRV
jgi:hypothetical protein